MPIDPRMVAWDTEIDPAKVSWDEEPSKVDRFIQGAGQVATDVGLGALRGAGSIGATILTPIDAIARKLGVQNDFVGRDDRREAMTQATQTMGANPDSWLYGGGKLAAEIAGTAGAGNALALPFKTLTSPAGQALYQGLQSGGLRVGELAGTTAGTAMRVGTGAATGGATAGLVDPEYVPTGMVVGGALPAAMQVAGKVGTAARNAIFPQASPEVAALAKRAETLGIQVPADRLVNSNPLNAAASSLNYVPFSGRAQTERRMAEQLDAAVSRTFGQNSSNVTQALRKAEPALGGEFERVLSNTGVRFDQQFLGDVADVYNKASRELGDDALRPIKSAIDDLVNKGSSGVIDGKAAYNIKRDLDRIGNANTPTAWHALELKRKLMDALNRSLGPDEAAAFAKTREQYGNMLDIQKLAKHGAEGGISAARLGNLPYRVDNPQLVELADIAAQFVKPREGAHGAAQRVTLGGLATAGGLLGGAPALAGVAAGAIGGRAANTLLNSNALRQGILGTAPITAQDLGLLGSSLYRASPLLAAQ